MRKHKDIRRNCHWYINLDERFFDDVISSVKLTTLKHMTYFMEVSVIARWARIFFNPFWFVGVFFMPVAALLIIEQPYIAKVVGCLVVVLMYITNKDLKPIRFCARNQMVYIMHKNKLYVIPFRKLKYQVIGQSDKLIDNGKDLTYDVCIFISEGIKLRKYIAYMCFYESIHGFLNYFKLYMRTGKEPNANEHMHEDDFVKKYFKKGDNPGYSVCFDFLFKPAVKYNKYLSIRREQWHPQMKIIEEQLERGEIPTPYKEMKVFEPGEIER
jgi:hypothetical protein